MSYNRITTNERVAQAEGQVRSFEETRSLHELNIARLNAQLEAADEIAGNQADNFRSTIENQIESENRAIKILDVSIAATEVEIESLQDQE